MTIYELVRYFLRLGTLGFGGPIALVGAMQRDLVERRRWFSPDDYAQGLTLAQVAPGPLAAQLAMYLGWLRAGWRGATVVGLAFILPSFVMVLALAATYTQLGELGWMRAAFYGIGPAVIAVIARSAVKLASMGAGRDPLRWIIFGGNAALTAWTGREAVWAILAGGVAVWIASAPRRIPSLAVLGGGGAWLFQGVHESASWPMLLRIAGYFAEAGVLVFGSGLAIVPFLHGGVVDQFHWLTERQFLDAVAVAMITPGPVVITVAFIGYLVAGPAGGLAAALGVFVPCYLFVLFLAPQYRQHSGRPWLKSVVAGVTAGACGAIAGAAVVLARRSIVNLPTLALFGGSLALLLTVRRLPEPVLMVLAGLTGILLAGGS